MSAGKQYGMGHVYLDGFWYSVIHDPKEQCWCAFKGEPVMLTRYCGATDKLGRVVAAMLRGEEVVVPCKVAGGKEDQLVRRAKTQLLRASLKINKYDPKKDFVGWVEQEQ
jgi:hypothetical protein